MKRDEQDNTLRDMMKIHGLRYSKPREAILRFFARRDRHISAEDLYLALKKEGKNLSLSTVYLNLSVLENAGLIREFAGVNGEALYDSNISPHYHLQCKNCGDIYDLPVLTTEGMPLAKLLKEHAETTSGWQVDEPGLNLRGLCSSCQAVNDAEANRK